MTNSLWSHRPASRVLAGIFSAMLLLSCLAACNPETTSDNSSGQASQNASTIDETLPAATEDPSLKGEGSVSLLEKLGSREKGFLFSGASWFTSREEYLSALSAIWPDVGQGELITEYEDSSSGVYLTQGMAQFTDFACPAAFRITETGGQVTACSFVFTFDKSEKEEYMEAFLQARDMLTETFSGADEDVPAFDAEFPNGATWYGDDGSGLGLTDTSSDSYQFEICLSAPQAQG